jgi:hypothetical protein
MATTLRYSTEGYEMSFHSRTNDLRVLQILFFSQFIEYSFDRHFGILAVSEYDYVWLFRRFIGCLETWHRAYSAISCSFINTFAVSSHTLGQGAVHINFKEMRNPLPSALAVEATVSCGIEDHGYSVLDEKPADVCQRLIENVTLFLAVERMRSKHTPQRVRFKDGNIQSARCQLSGEGSRQS